MYDVSYAVELEYLRDEDTGVAYPGLWLEIGSLRSQDAAVHIRCHLDSGASRSVVRGEVALALGLDLLSGPAQTFATFAGTRLDARLHRVLLSHPELGGHELEIGFATAPVARNLLGRDFFDLFQVGFREHHTRLYFARET